MEKYTYRWLRDEPCPGAESLACWVVERFPVDENSGYTRQVLWADQEAYRPWQIFFYDRKDAHLKTLTMADYQLYLDRYWQAGELTMVNHVTGKSTDLSWSDFEFGADIDDAEFTQTGLRRVR